jgi:hypothetical protein
MTQVGFRIVVHQTENHHYALAKRIGLLNGIFQGMIVICSLGLLHPVKHITILINLTII